MQKEVIPQLPFPLMAEIKEFESVLVDDEMIGKAHIYPAIGNKIRILMGLLDIAKKYIALGRAKSAALVYGKAVLLYDEYVK